MFPFRLLILRIIRHAHGNFMHENIYRDAVGNMRGILYHQVRELSFFFNFTFRETIE